MADKAKPETLPAAAMAELNELLWALPASLDPHEIVSVLLERCTRLFDTPLAGLWMRDGDDYALVGSFGFTDKKAEQLWQRLELEDAPAVSQRPDGAALTALGGFGKRRLGALLAVPLATSRELLGWLVFARLEPRMFSDLERSFVEILANRVAGALANARAFQDSQARAAELELLNEVADLLVSTTRLDELLVRLVHGMVETMNLSSCYIWMLDGDGPYMTLKALHHRDPDSLVELSTFLGARRLRVDEGRTAEIYKFREPIVVSDLANETVVPADVLKRLGHGSMAIVPLASRGAFFGAMYMVRGPRMRPLGPETIPFATHLANQVSVAIANARVYADLEAKVAERTHHLQELSEQLAQRMVNARDFFRALGQELHDEMAELESGLAAIDQALPPGEVVARSGVMASREAFRRLDDLHVRFLERLRRGDDLDMLLGRGDG